MKRWVRPSPRLFVRGQQHQEIDPQGLITETNPISTGPTNHYRAGIRQSRLAYLLHRRVSNSQQIIQGEYYFNRNISAVGTRDQNGVISFDLQMRSRKK